MDKKESIKCDVRPDGHGCIDMDLRLTDAQKLDIKKALKRGIYQELYDRDYLSDAQLNELIGRNI